MSGSGSAHQARGLTSTGAASAVQDAADPRIPEVSTQVAGKTGGVDRSGTSPPTSCPSKTHPQVYTLGADPAHPLHLADMRTAPFDKRPSARPRTTRSTARPSCEADGRPGKPPATTVHPRVRLRPVGAAVSLDPRKAMELLAQAGYPNGVDITLHSVRRVPARSRRSARGRPRRGSARRPRRGTRPGVEQFFQGDGKATHDVREWGYSVFDADAIRIRSITPSPAVDRQVVHARGGPDGLIDQGRSSVDPARRKTTRRSSGSSRRRRRTSTSSTSTTRSASRRRWSTRPAATSGSGSSTPGPRSSDGVSGGTRAIGGPA